MLVNFSCLLICLALVLFSEAKKSRQHHRVVLVSFDGFRWDYVGRYNTPNLDSLAREGVHAQVGIRTAFVTKTFPTHYTIATGLYEESHGIVNNRMYDPVFNASFSPGNNETRWWNGGEPIWITARLRGLRSGVYFWPGSEVKLKGIFADYYVNYNKKVDFKDRIDQVVEWLDDKKVDIAVTYFHEPDEAGHKCGVGTSCVGEAVEKADKTIGYLIERLKKMKLWEKTNLIIVSDHGMTNVTADEKHVLVLSDYLNVTSEIEMVPQDGTVANIIPKQGMIQRVYDSLSKAGVPWKVYKKEDIPERYHYKNNRRITPIIVIADEGYYIKQSRPYNKSRIGPGEHGYDNELDSMRPIFYARGPNFKANKTLPIFDTIHIYPLICHLLKINPSPNNGSITVFRDVLNGSKGQLAISSWLWITMSGILIYLRK